MEKKESNTVKLLAFLLGVAAFATASVFANGLMVPAQSLVMVVLAISALFAVIAMSLGKGISNCWPVFLFLIVASYFVVRAMCSPVRDLANEDLVLIAIAVLSFFVFTGLRGGGRWLLVSLVALTLLHVMVAWLQKFEFLPTHSTGRVKGLFWHYNYFADFAGAGLLACLVTIMWGKIQTAWRAGLMVVALLIMVAIYWSGSRGTILALVASGVVFLVLSNLALPSLAPELRRRYRALIVTSLFVGIIGGGGLVYQVLIERSEGATGGDLFFASTLRLYFLPMAIEQFYDAPLFGTGSRTFSYLCFQYWNPNLTLDRPNPEFVHNDHVQSLAEYGVVGYSLVLLFIGYSLICGVLSIRRMVYGRSPEMSSPQLPITGICLVLFACVHALVDFNLHLVPNLMVAVAGLVMIHNHPWRQRDNMAGKKADRLWLYGILLLVTPAVVHASAFGLRELAAGRALAEAGITKETSDWVPAQGKLDAHTAALAKAVEASPTFRRYAHLGLCYQIAAAGSDDPEQRKMMLNHAIKNYRASIERNPLNPVAKLNLAKTLGDIGAWDESDLVFREAMPTARVREPWLHGQLGWATMHSKRALEEWRQGDIDAAESAFKHAIKLAEVSRSMPMYMAHRDPKWLAGYTRINIYYARMLIAEKRLDDAERIFSRLNTLDKRDLTEPETKLVQHYADFLYRKAIHLWHQRKLDEAAALLNKSQEEYLRHRSLVEGEVDLEWDLGYEELQKTIAFFRKTGLMGKQRSTE